MVEGPLVGAADIHARLFANSLEALEGTQIVGCVAARFEVRPDFSGFFGFGGRGVFVGNVFVWHLIQNYVT